MANSKSIGIFHHLRRRAGSLLSLRDRRVLPRLAVVALVVFLGTRALRNPPADASYKDIGSSSSNQGSLSMDGVDPLASSTLQWADTHLGPVEIRLYPGADDGASSASLPPVVCLPGMNEKLKDEWAPVAHAMHQKGFRVAIIRFYSNPRTAPALLFGGVADADVQRLIFDGVIRGVFHSEKAIIMGKSWGGKQAALFTIDKPDAVSKLVAVCPGSSDPSMVQRLSAVLPHPPPVLLAWSHDDWITPFRKSQVWRKALPGLKFVETSDSGHRIAPVYVNEIVDFALN